MNDTHVYLSTQVSSANGDVMHSQTEYGGAHRGPRAHQQCYDTDMTLFLQCIKKRFQQVTNGQEIASYIHVLMTDDSNVFGAAMQNVFAISGGFLYNSPRRCAGETVNF